MPFRRDGSRRTGRKGCQIDLLIQAGESLHIVEIKRQARIGYEIIDQVKAKCKLVPRPSDATIRKALVYSGELAPSVEASGYFDAIVPFRRLLGL